MFIKSILIVLASISVLAAPALAASHHSWDQASTIGVGILGAASLGVPLIGNDVIGMDSTGLLMAGGSMAAGAGIAEGLKHVVHERRPDGSDSQSFPSAHTSVAFSAAGTLYARYGWQVGLPATLLASFVGVARVEAKKHHWYDVVAGAAIGEGSAFLITRPIDESVRLVPWGDSHGGGVAASVRF